MGSVAHLQRPASTGLPFRRPVLCRESGRSQWSSPARVL